jgi:uncharacterized protein with von Willebrand factor type A (vWA) domain
MVVEKVATVITIVKEQIVRYFHTLIFIRAFVSTKETKEIVEIAKEIGYVIMGNERVAASIVADLTYAFTKDKKINVRNLNI